MNSISLRALVSTNLSVVIKAFPVDYGTVIRTNVDAESDVITAGTDNGWRFNFDIKTHEVVCHVRNINSDLVNTIGMTPEQELLIRNTTIIVKAHEDRSAPVVNVGDVVTVQFGNPSDHSGYRTMVECKVLAIRKDIVTNYLLQEVANPEYLGVAGITPSHYRSEIYDDMYCTNARRWGISAQSWTGIRTFEQACQSLGFKDVELPN